jgi:hypothetical protein
MAKEGPASGVDPWGGGSDRGTDAGRDGESVPSPAQSAPDGEPDAGGPASALSVAWEGRTWPVVREAHFSESAYIAQEILATKLLIKGGLKDPEGKRVERARAHARWRYRGFQAGEIASL